MAPVGCGLEALFREAISGGDFPIPPPPPDTVLSGNSPVYPDASISLVDGEDKTLSGVTWERNGDAFTATLPGGIDRSNLRIIAAKGDIILKTIVPKAASGASVNAGSIDDITTAATLILEGKIAASGRGIGSMPGGSVAATLPSLKQDLQANSGVYGTFLSMVRRIIASGDRNAATSAAAMFRTAIFTKEYAAVSQSGLNPDYLTGKTLDYDNNGSPDNTTASFDSALTAAAKAFEFQTCYDPTQIRVVITVDMNDGTKDGNCDLIDKYKWVIPDPGDRMFFTGGIHEENEMQTDYDVANEKLGNWVPNRIPMYDDGTHGDANAGDGIWTVTFDLPWDPKCATAHPDHASATCLRIGFKYTFGLQGQGWTGTEEWPGNQRLLEIVDVNGDGLVARHDIFGDEASNKDKANLLRPINGGSGVVAWDTDANGDGVPDARERKNDTDGDCTVDTWQIPGNIEPITVDCQ